MDTFSEHRRLMIMAIVLAICCCLVPPVVAGSYRESAHGNAGYGANRSDLDAQYAAYATGNCAHCHEMHTSLSGSEPLPASGAAPHALFADGFNDGRIRNPYLETDNFCFYCHNDDSGARVKNQDYSITFGGGTPGEGPQSILDAFNQNSYHNLYDIKVFLENLPTFSAWFAKRGTPCGACHDSHLARRNWDNAQPGYPLLSAISRPGEVEKLWGENEKMQSYFSYEAPYAFGISREPGGAGDEDGGSMPDYVGFCTTCHNADHSIWSTSLNRNLRRINWTQAGLGPDKHGSLARAGQAALGEPYLTSGALKTNFVLSCLDCHEPHGSVNIMLLRTRINGDNLPQTLESFADLGHNCRRCHQDDLAALSGTGEANRWEHVHHGAADAPYVKNTCINCHDTTDGGSAIDCGNCHGHGMDDGWAGGRQTGRSTF